jgi:hypothetical protein
MQEKKVCLLIAVADVRQKLDWKYLSTTKFNHEYRLLTISYSFEYQISLYPYLRKISKNI